MSEESFMKVVSRIPLTWKCIRCEKEFPNHPGGEFPVAYETWRNPESGLNEVLGDICKECVSPHLKDSIK